MSTNKDETKSRNLDSTIIAAIIGGIVTIAVTLISVFGNRLNNSAPPPPTSTPVVIADTATWTASPVPTDTVPPGEPTSTPAPATDTPTATVTSVPPVALGEDWKAGCISTLWKVYPADIQVADKGNGCLQEPVFVFSAENGDLDFLASNLNDSTVYGLFAPLPESGSVSFRIRLRSLDNADILMGIYEAPDVSSRGLLMTIPHGNVKKRVIVQKDNVSAYTTMQGTGNLDQGDGYWFTFNYTLTSVRSTLNPSVFVTNPLSLASPQKWLFLGYKSVEKSYNIEGTFFDLKIGN